jgi:ABC-type glycerol-3-phosphate transport system substrate-binding protein
MKSSLKNYLRYNWWMYIVSAILVLALWLSVFSKLAELKANEQINITYIGSAFNHLELQSDLQDAMPDITNQNIKRVSVENAVVDGDYDLNTILRARSSGSCDFFIIESSVIEKYEMNLASYFSELSVSEIEKFFGNIGRVEEDGKLFGIELNENARLYDYYTGNGKLKIFFVNQSVNLSTLNGGDEEQDAAIQVIKFLAESNNVQT